MQNDVLYNRIMTEIKKSGGGGGGSDSIKCEWPEGVLNMTWKEIDDAIKAGKTVFLINSFFDDAVSFNVRYECLWTKGDEGHDRYYAFFSTIGFMDGGPKIDGWLFFAEHATDYPFID